MLDQHKHEEVIKNKDKEAQFLKQQNDIKLKYLNCLKDDKNPKSEAQNADGSKS